jgi:probable F420-dependent oxidoreductase
MEFGFAVPSIGPFTDPAALGDIVDAGEELGYADVWFGDHVVVPAYATELTDPAWLDPVVVSCLGLGRTSRIRFGTDVLVAPYRHPALVAKMVATAHHLTGGRLILATGIGYLRGEFDILGVDHRARGSITDEHLEILALLWGGDGPVRYDGTHFRFADAVFGPRPATPIPLWVGGNAPAARRRAARLGNGWHPLFPTPEDYARGRAEIEAARGGVAGPFTYSYSCGITTVLDEHPGRYVADTWASREGVPSDFGYAPPLPVTADGRLRFVGTPDHIAADVADYTAAGVEHITLRFSYGEPGADIKQFIRQLERFAAEVASRSGTT